jgi:multiple sugar transport system ATP-binding protein
MATVDLRSVSKAYRTSKRAEVYALTNLTLHVTSGELLVLLGPSGCGKTTTLRLIAGLEKASGGSITIDGSIVDETSPELRDVAMVFQRDALFPHLTVFENLALGATLRRVSKPEIDTRIKDVSTALGLVPILNRHPGELSGGQRQQVALGRAMVNQPKVLLLDEPFSNLDAPMRAQLRAELGRVHRSLGTTMLYVTHDQSEAMMLGHRVAVLREGVMQQVADPKTLYDHPSNLFVAGFVGSPPMNLFRGRVVARGGYFLFEEHNPVGAGVGSRLTVPLPAERGQRLSRFAEGNVVMGLRPEHLSPCEASAGVAAVMPIEFVECPGSETRLHFNTGAHQFVMRVNAQKRFQPGEELAVHVEVDKAAFFNPASGAPIV